MEGCKWLGIKRRFLKIVVNAKTGSPHRLRDREGRKVKTGEPRGVQRSQEGVRIVGRGWTDGAHRIRMFTAETPRRGGKD